MYGVHMGIILLICYVMISMWNQVVSEAREPSSRYYISPQQYADKKEHNTNRLEYSSVSNMDSDAHTENATMAKVGNLSLGNTSEELSYYNDDDIMVLVDLIQKEIDHLKPNNAGKIKPRNVEIGDSLRDRERFENGEVELDIYKQDESLPLHGPRDSAAVAQNDSVNVQNSTLTQYPAVYDTEDAKWEQPGAQVEPQTVNRPVPFDDFMGMLNPPQQEGYQQYTQEEMENAQTVDEEKQIILGKSNSKDDVKLASDTERPFKVRGPMESLKTYNCSKGGNPYCLTSPIHTVLRPKQRCDPNHTIDVVLLIASAIENIEKRVLIRYSWLVRSSQLRGRTKHVFLLGKGKEDFQWRIEKENAYFGDILQGNFMDTYRNLTLKTIMGYTWFRDECPKARFLVKSDDDVFVNTKAMLNYAESEINQTHAMMGYCGERVKKPLYSPRHRWYMSEDQYPDRFYPPYCCGCGYIITAATATHIADVMQWLPIFPIEDLFTGVAITRLGFHVDIINEPDRFLQPNQGPRSRDTCELLRNGQVLAVHHMPIDVMYSYAYKCRYSGWRVNRIWLSFIFIVLIERCPCHGRN